MTRMSPGRKDISLGKQGVISVTVVIETPTPVFVAECPTNTKKKSRF